MTRDRAGFLTNGVPWHYVYLTDVSTTEHGSLLLCGTLPHQANIEIHCAPDEAEALRPYLELHATWLQDPLGIECPLVPVVRERTGRLAFSFEGAHYDYPDTFALTDA